ncbi:MAG: hypothetical protein ACXWUG_26415, partial [Polyangiales bacterium]
MGWDLSERRAMRASRDSRVPVACTATPRSATCCLRGNAHEEMPEIPGGVRLAMRSAMTDNLEPMREGEIVGGRFVIEALAGT